MHSVFVDYRIFCSELCMSAAAISVCSVLHLQSLKARARIELREESTEQDARDVIEIMKYR